MKLKQYKLKRELPTFTAGSEFIICCGNLIEVKPDGTLGVCAYSGTTLKKFPNILTDWFDEVKEPLIKDEKIRKAVRAWAEANVINSGHYYNTDIKFDATEHRLQWIQTAIEFNDITGLENLEDGETYTIAELCGEEEE